MRRTNGRSGNGELIDFPKPLELVMPNASAGVLVSHEGMVNFLPLRQQRGIPFAVERASKTGNRAAVAVRGVSRDSIARFILKIDDLVPPEIRDQIRRHLAQILSQPQEASVQHLGPVA